MRNAAYWIDRLKLKPHPEGGHYRETYRADLTLPRLALAAAFHGDRSASTAIYFLLEGKDFSAFHRIASDEMWHFYAGHTLTIHVIDDTGTHTAMRLGPNADQGDQFQAVVPAGCWFASCLEQAETFALAGCTVAPGFDFAEFEMAARSALAAQYPQHRELIERLTRDGE
jgi:predicted cupin superfamily sugar epimerase